MRNYTRAVWCHIHMPEIKTRLGGRFVPPYLPLYRVSSLPKKTMSITNHFFFLHFNFHFQSRLRYGKKGVKWWMAMSNRWEFLIDFIVVNAGGRYVDTSRFIIKAKLRLVLIFSSSIILVAYVLHAQIAYYMCYLFSCENQHISSKFQWTVIIKIDWWFLSSFLS